MQKIIVDLTPLLPGGDNGGAKIMSLDLIKYLAKINNDVTYYLLGNDNNFDELNNLQNKNIKIINIDTLVVKKADLISRILQKYAKYIPNSAHKVWQRFLNFSKQKKIAKNIKKTIAPHLLFCPFTAPYFYHLNIPIVSIVYDLQSHYYPYFFSKTDQYYRKRTFKKTCKLVSKIITTSDFVKTTVLANSRLSPSKVNTIYTRLAKRLTIATPATITKILKKYNLEENNYLLFPANFWHHKNHKLLFVAFNLYRKTYADSRLKLVCTGSGENNKNLLKIARDTMGLSSEIIFPGFLSNNEFSALLSGCLSIVFPSLYEGFGMPVLEAMAAGKPVICSNVTSLPEIAGDAALLFDPRKPQEIVNAIYRIEHEPDLVTDLINRGHARSTQFGTLEKMAQEYFAVFQTLLSKA